MNNEQPLTPDELQSRVYALGRLVEAPAGLCRLNFVRTDSGAPHIEFVAGAYHYVVTERGEEYSREACNEIDEILFAIFKHITFSMVVRYEVDNRDESKDSRRMLFDYQLKLLGAISEEWATKRQREFERVLLVNPFNDPS